MRLIHLEAISLQKVCLLGACATSAPPVGEGFVATEDGSRVRYVMVEGPQVVMIPWPCTWPSRWRLSPRGAGPPGGRTNRWCR